jgi:Ni/Fe-hydrogenase 1 B-type cytochrome subunit
MAAVEATAPSRGSPDTAAAASSPGLEPVYVWDVVVRLTHWVIVFSMLVLAVTGIDISSPFLDSSSGKPGFTTAWVKIVHYYASIAFALAVATRVVWMFLGPRRSGWRQFVPASKKRLIGVWETLKFYLLLRPRPPESAGHNPLAGLAYLVVFFLFLLMIASGFALYSVSAYTSYMKMWHVLLPLFGGPQGARWIHHITTWVLIMFVVQHVFSAILTSRTEKNGTMDSMFSGFKFLRRDREVDDD